MQKMPILFLSPSTQEYNPYVTSGNEEYWMNRLTDEMEPYLLASGIDFVRNDPQTNAAVAIRKSNEGMYDFHLSLHSNAAPMGKEGTMRGIDIYYYPGSADSLRMAQILADNLKVVYPLPERVQTIATRNLGEVSRTNAPAVLAELGYHDNPEDAMWVETNLSAIAAALVLGITEYFGVPFQQPQPIRTGTVAVQWGRLNIRDLPTTDSDVITRAENGEAVTVYGEEGNWYSVGLRGVVGYANTAYIMVD